ncbi:hypothetical protein BROOK1789C_1888 [Bathymodiolus brooksi thiotrophic gill symbiont]|nr:hypothetical protein BROOK1789C_1888 [Bathymodiolus brooksi thiotrophic gill symbiont]
MLAPVLAIGRLIWLSVKVIKMALPPLLSVRAGFISPLMV